MKPPVRLRCTVPMACRIRCEQVKHGALLHPGAVPQYRPRHPRHSRTGSAPIYAPGRRSVENRRPHLRPEARSERSEGRLLRQAGRSLDLHHKQPVLPVERHRGAGRGGRYAERLGRRISERLPGDRDQSMERREGSPNAVSERGGRAQTPSRLPQVACWLRLRVWSLARKVVTRRAVRALRQTLPRPALRQLRRLASTGADLRPAWTGPRLWN